MDVRKVVFALAIVGLVAAAAWLTWSATTGQPPASTAPNGRAAAGDMVPASAGIEPANAPLDTDRTPATNRAVAAAAPLGSPRDGTATVRGRCIDAADNPLADCSVTIVGSSREHKLDEWLRDHEAPDWRDLEQSTGADGVFVFTFWPPPTMSFAISATHSGCGTLSTGIKLDPGASIDVGDVLLLPGVQLTGAVVDAQQRPVPDVEVHIAARRDQNGFGFDAASTAARANHRLGPAPVQAISDAAGRFRMPTLLAPGGYLARLAHGGAHRDPHELDLRSERAVEDVTLVCSLPADAPTVTGRVVDDQGLGVAGATIRLGKPSSRTRHGGVSDQDGTFRVRRSPDPEIPDENVLWAQKQGYLPSPTTQLLAWGTRDVELRLGSGGTLVVRVTDADDRPVEQFTVRVVEGGGRAVDSARVRARGPFANGIATIPGIAAGVSWLAVEFPTASRLVTHVDKLSFDGERGRVDVRAEAEVTRTLRVVGSDGQPVVGTRVELLDRTLGRFDANTDAEPLAIYLRRADQKFAVGLLVGDGVTAADGTFSMRGSATRPQGLRVLGPGHIAHRDPAVDLSAPGDLVVTVQQGAKLVARITPPAMLEELRRRAGIEPGAAFAPRSRPWLQLFRPTAQGESEESWPPSEGKELAGMEADGSFALEAIPPGTWHVGVRHWHVQSGSSAVLDRLDAAQITVADGEMRKLDLDLAFVLPGILEGLVEHNGQPMTSTKVMLVTDAAQDQRTSRATDTDSDGRFRLLLVPGRYTLKCVLDLRTPQSRYATASGEAEVFRDRVTQQTFHISTGALELRLRHHDGAPAADIVLRLGDDNPRGSRLPPTDAAGITRIDWPVGTHTVFAQRARNDHVRLGTIDARPGQNTSAELRLPDGW